MRAAYYETNDFGYGALEIYTSDTEVLIGPILLNDGDTVVLVEDEYLNEIDNMNHIVGVHYLYDEPA